jgi:tetratricopeptide (TPR) repeat protein
MADRKDEGGVFRFVDVIQGRITKLISLLTAIVGLLVLFKIERFIALVVAVTIVPALILVYVCTEKQSSIHDPRKKHYKYGKPRRRAALAGVFLLATAAGLIIWNHIYVRPLVCPPVTVTITRFIGDDGKIQAILDQSLREQLSGKEIKFNPRDVVVPGQGEILERVDAAKKYANSREGHGNIVIWGDVASRAALGAVANECDRAGGNLSAALQTPTNARTGAFEFHFDVSGDVQADLIDFARFVIGVVLYEQGRWEESADVFTDVRSPFGALYEGLARQEFARTPDQMKRAIQAYERCVGSWLSPNPRMDNEAKAIAVAAYINASNALLELSNLDPANAKAHLESAFSGYKEAIDRYGQLEKESMQRYGHVKLNAIVGSDWRTIAQTNRAITKIKLAAGDKGQRPEWLHDAEQDLNNILGQLDENNVSDRESWVIAKANLGALCLELSRVEPERIKRLSEAEDHLSKALAALDTIQKCDASVQNEHGYDCAVLKSNLGIVYWERALDEPTRDEALQYLARAEQKYAEAIRLFSADPSYSVESAEEMSHQGLVLIERARWFENGEREGLLRKAVQDSTDALRSCRSDLNPLEWASITNNLAYAKRELGKKLEDSELLKDSVELCKESLTVLHYEHVYQRIEWAAAQRNLGESLYAFGVATSNMQQVSCAMSAYQAALQVWTDHNAYYDWTKTQQLLGDARATLVANGVQVPANGAQVPPC